MMEHTDGQFCSSGYRDAIGIITAWAVSDFMTNSSESYNDRIIISGSDENGFSAHWTARGHRTS